ncbi:MAG: hypothetical protein JW798_13715 [Prolixibacteraceae bacterium]|nr:hypothetical protein [Prolixibacteraceae bacterium]
MRTRFFITIGSFMILLSSCVSFGGDYNNANLGGSTDLDVNQVGYKYYGALSIDGSYVNSNTKATVISNEGGIIEVEVTGTIPEELRELVTSSPYVGEDGEVTLSGKFKNSTEGVVYINADGEKTILVKYNCEVGDKWSYTTKGGKVLEREVISKSTEDDFLWSGMLIKVIEIEQNLPYPGFSKTIYRANHKWGMVNIDVYLEDGSKVSMYF